MPSRKGCASAILLLVATLASCARTGEDVQRQLHALGTIVTISYFGADAEAARRATAELASLYRQAGADWYPWHPPGKGGELSRINAAIARGEAVTVSPQLAALLRRAAVLEERSGGLFNVALGTLTELWGFDEPLRADWRPPPPSAVAAAIADAPGSRHLQWDGLRLTSSSRNLVIDPGGIAKGELLRLSIGILRRHGIAHAIVDLGGDLSVLGTVHGRAARIGIRDPAGGEPLGGIEARGGETVVTSGNYERYFEFDGTRYAHVIDPRSGWPAAGAASVTVIHEDPVLADAAATALLVAGAAKFEETCAALDIEQAALIGSRGDLRLTDGMRERVHWR